MRNWWPKFNVFLQIWILASIAEMGIREYMTEELVINPWRCLMIGWLLWAIDFTAKAYSLVWRFRRLEYEQDILDLMQQSRENTHEEVKDVL